MKRKSKIRSVPLIFTVLMLVLSAGLTGCREDGAEFLEEELTKEEEPDAGADSVKESAGADISEKPETGNSVSEVPVQQPEESPVPSTIYVDVCGAVNSPGVYELSAGSRVFQAIEKAGGYLPEAALSYLNRAKGLSDGQQIYVPTQAEVDSQTIAATEEGSGAAETDGNSADTAQAAEKDSAAGTGDKIQLNTADVSQLTTLAGIGESKARAIIAYREENGPFTSVEDIMNVPGIKEGTYEKIKDKIAIE